MQLTAVDIGNTSVKVTLFLGEKFHGSHVFASLKDAEGEIKGAVAYCSTRELDAAEKDLLESRQAWELDSMCRLPIEICYDTPTTLGADRLAAAVGANGLFPRRNLLIADAGTALTIDVVDSEDRYRGGNISPGVELRLKALHKFTSRLPMVAVDMEDDSYFGHDTASAIGCGVRWGLVNEIAGAFALAKREYGCELLILTGGSGENLFHDLKKVIPEGIGLEYNPELVARGLLLAYNYNHDK